MRIFVFEHATGGGFVGEDIPESWMREGDLMLGALLRDLSAVPGLDIVTTRDARLPPLDAPARVRSLRDRDDVWPCWRRCATEADAVWPIAPETGGELERFTRMVLACGRRLLGSGPEAVRVAGSKLRTAELLGRHGVAVVGTQRADDPLPPAPRGWVVKPDDGAGALETRWFDGEDALRAWLAEAGRRETCVVQPYVEGDSLSLSLLCQDGRTRMLTRNRQRIVVENGAMRYLGGTVGLETGHAQEARAMAEAVAAALPGLWGYVGIDFIGTADGPVLVEVNPRLTTSYIGMHEALGRNPAQMVLALLGGRLEEACVPGLPAKEVELRLDAETAHV